MKYKKGEKGGKEECYFEYLVLQVAIEVVGEETAPTALGGTKGDSLQNLGDSSSWHESCTSR